VIESNTCLLPMITDQSRFLLRMHTHYENRVLPYQGGILDQPNYYIEAMEVIGERVAHIQLEVAERARRDAAANRRGGMDLQDLMRQ
jgi:hypothetical protein